LVRAILAAMAARKADSAPSGFIPLTCGALENDEIFVDSITADNHDAFVIEDADHLLMARSNAMWIYTASLAVADGWSARRAGRSSLPPICLTSGIDEALCGRPLLCDGAHSGAGAIRGSIVLARIRAPR